MAFKDVKTVWKVGIIFYLIALIAYIVGFATPQWFGINLDSFGLFRVCSYIICFDSSDIGDLNNGITESNLWIPSQAVIGTGLAALLIGGISAVVAVAVGQAVLSLCGGFLVIIGGIFGLAGGIFFMVRATDIYDRVDSYVVGYSSILLLISSIVEIISGSLLLAGRPPLNSVGV